MMIKRALFVLSLAAFAALPAGVWTQEPGYPIEVVPPGKGTFTFAPACQAPWDQSRMPVTPPMSPKRFVPRGSDGPDPAQPDASGRRAIALCGRAGVLLMDTENRQVAEKTLAAIRSFTAGPL